MIVYDNSKENDDIKIAIYVNVLSQCLTHCKL